MSPVGFELAILAIERPQTYALDHATTWIDDRLNHSKLFSANPVHV
jgi:hypothetical protein